MCFSHQAANDVRLVRVAVALSAPLCGNHAEAWPEGTAVLQQLPAEVHCPGCERRVVVSENCRALLLFALLRILLWGFWGVGQEEGCAEMKY